MRLVLEDVKKNTVVDSVKGCREIYDEDDNEFKKKSFTTMVTFVTKL